MSSKSPPMVRTSERTSFKRCRLAWHWQFERRLKPRYTAPALRFGSLVHKALEGYYRPGLKRGPHPAELFVAAYDAELEEAGKFGFKDEDGTWHDARELGVGMLEGYIRKYGKDDRYEVLVTEFPFQVPIRNPRTGRTVALYTGIMDGVWRDTHEDKTFIMDHKTAKSISLGHLPLDEQAGAYWTFVQEAIRKEGLIKKDQVLDGMLYNFLRKAVPDPTANYDDQGRKLNKDGTVSKAQPPAYFQRERVWRSEADHETVRQRVYEELRDMHLVKKDARKAYKSPGTFNCAGCGYRDACELHESGADYEAFMEQTMQSWEPYSAHEVYDAR